MPVNQKAYKLPTVPVQISRSQPDVDACQVQQDTLNIPGESHAPACITAQNNASGLASRWRGVVAGYVWPQLTWNKLLRLQLEEFLVKHNTTCLGKNKPAQGAYPKFPQVNTHEIRVYSTDFLQPTSGGMTLFYTISPALPLWLRDYYVKACFGVNPLRWVLMRSFTKDPALWECTHSSQ